MKHRKGKRTTRTPQEQEELTLKCKKKWEESVKSGKIKRVSKTKMYYKFD